MLFLFIQSLCSCPNATSYTLFVSNLDMGQSVVQVHGTSCTVVKLLCLFVVSLNN